MEADWQRATSNRMSSIFRRIVRWVVASLTTFLTLTAVGGELLKIRWNDGPTYSRVVLDMTERTAIRTTESLDNPPRFYLDLVDARQARSYTSPRLKSDLVSRIRVGNQGSGILRVVLDLKTDNKPKVSTLGPYGSVGYRIIIDIPRDHTQRECPNERPKDVLIVIDPGHGGEDPGATAVNGVHEKKIVLSVAKYMKQYLEEYPGFKGILSRTGDYEVPLESRRRRAEQEKAHLFVSIHADAFKTSKPKGASVFVLSKGRAKTELTRWLEKNENKSDWVGGVSNWLNTDCFSGSNALLILNEKTQQEMLVEGVDIGKTILESLDVLGNIHPKGIDRKTGQYVVSDAGFAVLKATSVPSILVEAGFLSNPQEGRLLSTTSYQKEVAKAIVNGIVRYFCAKPPWHTDLQTGVKRCPAGTMTYVVRKGDTLSEIALQNKTSVATLRRINNLRRDMIRIGQKLTIPIR